METSAIVMMVIGIVVVWGGLITSVTHAVIKAKKN
ncbi:methionine/alanine import family NSS transporter small subunit [Litchfieldia salsa]|uniref:Putative methionine and alanine importer, small subunit n=1 Tax=Litchfieldia salsa TaxID=930152 RepID=A0A1H0WQ32_9BACI|nr:methionine/alanine import family NSS transporter small subunit [Litchfieldia salsa]SDP92792.1 Putative methionine and alanine importer, small subunit [Litchfieldia salsa]